jgi:hypothetical protein
MSEARSRFRLLRNLRGATMRTIASGVRAQPWSPFRLDHRPALCACRRRPDRRRGTRPHPPVAPRSARQAGRQLPCRAIASAPDLLAARTKRPRARRHRPLVLTSPKRRFRRQGVAKRRSGQAGSRRLACGSRFASVRSRRRQPNGRSHGRRTLTGLVMRWPIADRLLRMSFAGRLPFRQGARWVATGEVRYAALAGAATGGRVATSQRPPRRAV